MFLAFEKILPDLRVDPRFSLTPAKHSEAQRRTASAAAAASADLRFGRGLDSGTKADPWKMFGRWGAGVG